MDTTDRLLQTKLNTVTTFEAARLHSKQKSLKSYSQNRHINAPVHLLCIQVNRSPKYTTDRLLQTKLNTVTIFEAAAYTQNKRSLKSYSQNRHINAPVHLLCIQVNRSPKYTTDRLLQQNLISVTIFEAADYTQNKQSLKSYFTKQAHKCPSASLCIQVNRSPKYTTDRLETKQYTQLSKLLRFHSKQTSLKS